MLFRLKVYFICLASIFITRVAVADLLDEPSPVSNANPSTSGVSETQGKSTTSPTEDKATKSVDKTSGGTTRKGKNQSTSSNPSEKSNKSSVQNAKRPPIEFKSSGLSGQRSKGSIRLVDNVVVWQGDLRLEANEAVIYYDEKTSEVARIVATGNVRMNRSSKDLPEKIRAEGQELVFYNFDRKVILRGNAKLWRGGDLIRGREIIYDLDKAIIRADRVDGLVQPKEADK